MRIGFGNWAPDAAAVDVKDQSGRFIMAKAENVYPCESHYMSIPSLANFTNSPLPAPALGIFAARVSAGGWVIFAGTQTKLYKLVSGAWVDFTRVSGGNYNVAAGDFWSFTQFGSQVIACNINDVPQVIDVDTGATAFSALGGSPPQARYVTVVGDFLVLACLSTNKRIVINSAINSTTGWTLGVNLCDQQEFPDGGNVTGVAGGEYGWIVQERSIRRMIFQPGFDQAFRFERVEKERGSAAGYAVVSNGINRVFVLSDDGFYAYGQDGLTSIGHRRVNEWFRANSDPARFFSVNSFQDPFAPRICWSFYSSPSTTYFDRLLIYDWQLDEWSYAKQTAQVWARLTMPATTLEGLDIYGSIDTGVPYSLDSRVWEGGLPVIGAIGSDGNLALQQGAPLTATLLTCPMQLTPSQRSAVLSVYPIGIFNDATIGIRVGKREHTKNPVVYSGTLTPSTRSGIARLKSSGRIHEIELTLTQSSGNAWQYAEGLDVGSEPDGMQ